MSKVPKGQPVSQLLKLDGFLARQARANNVIGLLGQEMGRYRYRQIEKLQTGGLIAENQP